MGKQDLNIKTKQMEMNTTPAVSAIFVTLTTARKNSNSINLTSKK